MGQLSPSEASGWVAEHYPELTIADGLLSGVITVNASFDPASGLFYIIRPDNDPAPGLLFSGKFTLEIKGSIETSALVLPLLYVADVEHSANRHFNQTDGAACLCSPLETEEFLQPNFDLHKFLDRLVLPFLYGQLYFDQHGRWPWPDYAHGIIGLLESYFRIQNPNKGFECLNALSQDSSWPRIKALLVSKQPMKGHNLCFCSKRNHIRSCHPDAWLGIRKLHHDVRMAMIDCRKIGST